MAVSKVAARTREECREICRLDRSLRLVGLFLLPLSVLLIVHLTLEPYTFTMPAGKQAHPLGLWMRFWNGASNPGDIVNNLVLFMTLGFSLACLLQGTRLRPLAKPVVAYAVGFGLSLTVELAQLYVPGRTSTRIDVIANATGTLIGYGIWLIARVWSKSPARVMAALAVYLVLGVAALAGQSTADSLGNWDRQMPLSIGNEATGDHPWRGEVERLQIVNGVTGAAPGATWVEPGSGQDVLLADYVREANGAYSDQSGQLPDLLPQLSTGAVMKGYDSGPHRWYSTETPVPELSEPLGASSTFTIIVRVAAADLEQHGPARIVSLSDSPYLRNFTLGQEGRDLIFRLRTPATGLNGVWPELRVPNVFTDTRPRDIVIRYEHGTVHCVIDGVLQPNVLEITPQWALLAHLAPPEVLRIISGWVPFLSVSTLSLPALICLVLLFVPAGLLAALAGIQVKARPGQRGYHWLFVVALMVLGLSFGLKGLLFLGGALGLQGVEGPLGLALAVGSSALFSMRAGLWRLQR